MLELSLARYVDFFEHLSLERLANLQDVMTEDVHFADPFNAVVGIEAARRIFTHMFEHFDGPRFTVTLAAMVPGPQHPGMRNPEALGSRQAVALLSWELHAHLKRDGKPWRIVGMSEVCFAADGRVSSHVDHWDAARQFYERLPIIGWLLRKIRARLEV